MTTNLAKSQPNDFERDGFLIVPGLFSLTEMRNVAASMDELVARPPEIGKQMVYFEDSLREPGQRVLSRIERFIEYQPTLAALVSDPRIVDLTSRLLGDRAVLFKDKINFK